MTARTYVGTVGAIAAIIGAIFLFLTPLHVSNSYETNVSCSARDSSAAQDEVLKRAQESFGGRESREPRISELCTQAKATRQYWTVPLLAIGGIVAIGALVIGRDLRDGV